MSRFFDEGRWGLCVGCVNLADDGECQVVQGVEQSAHCPYLREYVRFEAIVLYGNARKLMDKAQGKQ